MDVKSVIADFLASQSKIDPDITSVAPDSTTEEAVLVDQPHLSEEGELVSEEDDTNNNQQQSSLHVLPQSSSSRKREQRDARTGSSRVRREHSPPRLSSRASRVRSSRLTAHERLGRRHEHRSSRSREDGHSSGHPDRSVLCVCLA